MSLRLRHLPLLAGLCVAALSSPVWAEKADKDKPVNIESDRMTVDDQNKVTLFEGRVSLSQGSLSIRCQKLVITQDKEGNFRATATANPNALVQFRQKREGSSDYVEGESERLEHDSQLDQTELFNRAWIRSGKDEIRGEYILVDGKTGNYNANGGPQASGKGNYRVRAVIQPKKDSTTPLPASPNLKASH